MGVTGKLVEQVEINSHGDVFHNFYRHKPHDISSICECVHGVDLVGGEQGTVGSVIRWHYTHNGKKETMKQVIEEIDETNHKIVFKVLESDVLEIYESFKVIFHVEPKGDKQLVVWTVEFEKPDESVPDPTSFMDILVGEIKDLDAHHASTK